MRRVLLPFLALSIVAATGCGGGSGETSTSAAAPKVDWTAERATLERSQAAVNVRDADSRARLVDAVIAARRAASEGEPADAVRRQGRAFANALVDDYEAGASFWTLEAAEHAVKDWMVGAPRQACETAAEAIMGRFDPTEFPGDPNDPAWDRQRKAAPAAFADSCSVADA
jgi:hypothetical protein